MIRIPRFPKASPYRHVVMLFIVSVLFAASATLDALLMVTYSWIDFLWTIPLITAAIVLSPIEVVGFTLAAVFASLASQVSEGAELNFITTSIVGVFGMVAAAKASVIKRYTYRINIIRNALEESPLAYAEFSFPGYKLVNYNKTFIQLNPERVKIGAPLGEILPKPAAMEMSGKMDESVNTRKRVDCDELNIFTIAGGNSYWRATFIPVLSEGRRTPRSVAFFAIDSTDAVNRTRTREATLRISAAVMSSLSLDETIRVVLDNLAFIAGTDGGALFLLEDDQWVGMAGYGEHSDETVKQLRWPYEDFPIGAAAVGSKEALVAEHPLEDPRFIRERLERFNVKSALVVPLVSSNRSIGAVLLSQTDSPRQFTDEQVKFATVIGSHGALAIENAAIYENEHYIRKSLEAIEAISEAGLVSLDLEEVLVELVTRTQDVMQMDAAMILLADESGRELVARAAAGNISVPLHEFRMKVGEGLAGRAFKEATPMKIDNIQEHPQAGEMCPFAENSGVKSVLAVPLRMSGKVAGVLQIGSQREKAFSAREWGLIQVLADRASMAVQNSLLHETTRKELARVALLRDVAAACAGSHDITKIAQQALEAIHEQLGCSRASIYSLDEEMGAMINLAFTGHTDEIMAEYRISPLDRAGLLSRAIMERRMITHEEIDLSNATESEAYMLRALDAGFNRRCTLPIIYKDEVVGGMAMVFPDKRPWSPAAVETVISIANQLAVAIHSCELPREDEAALSGENRD
ncbi:MAG: GAF domain-containing protein [Actinobacteria bacterium]|nr:GAF domain-containing protein [Actinomycetota bacterium]MCL5882715.1 GAF domain-containing protein [Actinomycetota bacterium]